MKSKLSLLKHKFLLIIRDEATLEWKFSFRLTMMNVVIVAGIGAILLIIVTTYIIAFTPLREYIPGYADIGIDRKVRELTLRTDSLQKNLQFKEEYINNIKRILLGKDAYDTTEKRTTNNEQLKTKYANITNKKSVEDSIFRKELENRDRYSLGNNEQQITSSNSIRNYFFFTPLKGIITNNFNTALGHYGIDIVAKQNEPVKSVLDGTVVLADWTVKTGYIIAIQHQSNIISVYKHNSALMKKEGAYVKAGEVIAIIGNSGELSSGPHLHFELWHDGKPINPLEFMRF